MGARYGPDLTDLIFDYRVCVTARRQQPYLRIDGQEYGVMHAVAVIANVDAAALDGIARAVSGSRARPRIAGTRRGSAARAQEPGLEFPAGEACSFALGIDIGGGGRLAAA